MRNLRLLLVGALLAALTGGAPAQQEPQDTAGSRPQIEQAVLVRLVRSILIAVNNANLTGNYTVLRDLGSPSFAANNTAATLAERFQPLREGRVDLSPILVLPINLSRAPQVDSEGRLDIEGAVPTRPLLVSFRMRFEPVDGSWRLSDLAIGLNAAEDPDQQASETNGTEPATPEADAEEAKPETETTAAPAQAPPAPRVVPLPTPKPDVE